MQRVIDEHQENSPEIIILSDFNFRLVLETDRIQQELTEINQKKKHVKQ